MAINNTAKCSLHLNVTYFLKQPRLSKIEKGALSKSVKIVDPVVVRPDVASKKESV